MKVLYAEDDPYLSSCLRKSLKKSGIRLDISPFGDESFEMIKTWKYDAMLIDIGLPDRSGNEIIQKIRISPKEHINSIPIIVISGKKNTEDKLQSFILGADDYVTKPFDENEILFRIHSVVRRSKRLSKNIIKKGEIEFNLASKRIKVNSKVLELTGKEHELFQYLFLNAGYNLEKKEILDYLYEVGEQKKPTLKIIDVLICKIRHKLRQLTDKEYLKTSWGQGYMIDTQCDNTNQDFEKISNAKENQDLGLEVF